MKQRKKKTNKKITALNVICVLMMLVLSSILIGCMQPQEHQEQDEKNQQGKTESDIKPPDSQIDPDKPGEIYEKRGEKTNITEMSQFLRRLTSFDQFKYKYRDTEFPEEYDYAFKGRFIRVGLGDMKEHETGERYDEILMDRVTKQAFSHCGAEECGTDKEVERVDYEEYYRWDPLERVTRAVDAEYIGEDMVGNDCTKVFSMTYENKPGKVWIQEYWGYPIKFEIEQDDGKRVIEYKDMEIDNTRYAEIEMPFNFTIKGEEGYWWTWEHYLKIGQYADERNPLKGNVHMPQAKA